MNSELVTEHILVPCPVLGSRLGLVGIGPVSIQPTLCVFGEPRGRPACFRIRVRLANGRLVLLHLLPFAPFGSFRLHYVSIFRPGPSILLRLFLSWGVRLKDNVLKVCGVMPPALGFPILGFAIVLFVLRAPKITVGSRTCIVIGVIVGEIYTRIPRLLAFRVLSTFPGRSRGSFVVSVGPLSALSTAFECSHVNKSVFLSPLRRPTVALVVPDILGVGFSSQCKVPFSEMFQQHLYIEIVAMALS